MTQREIKFRAWNGKVIYEVQELHFCVMGGKGIRKIIGSGIGGMAPELKNAVPMQYTGLKDKNGKEIYEGDVISFSVPSFRYSAEGCLYTLEVGFNLDDYPSFSSIVRKAESSHPSIKPEMPIGMLWSLKVTSEGVIAGNIYENPELIGGAK